MGSLNVTAHVRVEGPIADGSADQAVKDMLRAIVQELVNRGKEQIRVSADAMNRSGRGGTGRAAAGVQSEDHGEYGQVIYGGIREGEYSWPWLEGTSRRNRTTRFRGYHTFRDTARDLDDQAAQVAEEKLQEYLPAMGGG
jgi:hypothetical protein